MTETVKLKTPKKKEHYVSNKEFLEAMKDFKNKCLIAEKKGKIEITHAHTHTHKAVNDTVNREEEPPHISSDDTKDIVVKKSTVRASPGSTS